MINKDTIVAGLMSGTSLDGIDAVLIKIRENLSFDFLGGIVYEYSQNMKNRIKALFNPQITAEEICKMNFLIGEEFSNAVLELSKTYSMPLKNIDLIGSSGITLYHQPKDEYFEEKNTKSTLQIGESSIIAYRTGITTISDFRQKDIAAGGQGAPLVPFFDEIFFKPLNKNFAIQNIGGIGNVTVISKTCETFAFDTGVGNMLIDYMVQKFFNIPYDKNGEIAFSGKINENWLKKLMQEPYLKLSPPKSTGRELFGKDYAEKILKSAPSNKNDIITTITEFTVQSIVDAYNRFVFPKTNIDELILGGGGAYNKYIKHSLQENFKGKLLVKTHEDYNVSDKYKEAIAFAMLAYTAFKEIPNNIKTATGSEKSVILGKITYGG